MADQVAVLERIEQVRPNPERLAELCAKLGVREAEDTICRTMEELAVRLSFTERQWRQRNLPELRKSVRALVSIADRVGLHCMACVAADAVVCLDRQDEVALSAVLNRLIRLGEGALTAIWDIEGA